MKKFIAKVLVFFVLMFVFDRLVGYTFSYMSKHSKGGYVRHHNYIIDGVKEDVLIFGSSRAIHHYNPQIFKDSLGLSCYNCGQDGNGILLYYGWWQIIKEHYNPKLIVYDVFDSFDILAGDDNHKYLGFLKESYDRANVHEIFDDVDKKERIKMMSQMYRYNSKFHQIIADFIHPIYKVNENGFVPLYGELDTLRIKNEEDMMVESYKIDTLKIAYLNRLIDETKNIKLVFAISPYWYNINSNTYSAIVDLCHKRNIPLLNFSNDPKYCHNNKYFKDGVHLNADGANEYTKDITRKLKEILSQVSSEASP